MSRIAVTQEADKAEIAISGYLTFAKITMEQADPVVWNIDLDDHKTGKHTAVVCGSSSLDEAVRLAGLALLGKAVEDEYSSMEDLMASPLVQGWISAESEDTDESLAAERRTLRERALGRHMDGTE